MTETSEDMRLMQQRHSQNKLTSISVLTLNLSVVIVQRLQILVTIHCSTS